MSNIISRSTTQYLLLLIILLLSPIITLAQVKTYELKPFSKVIISPHIEVNFIEGDQESVIIHSISESLDKFNLEQSGEEIHLYLEDAKTTTKNKKIHMNGHSHKSPYYDGTVVTATVVYKNLASLSLRGEENFTVESVLKNDRFNLSIYGESEVDIKSINVNELHTAIYGESKLSIKQGKIDKHKMVCYGESEINTEKATTSEVKITAYGESEFNLKVEDLIRVTAYGEASIKYSGSPEIKKGIVIGDTSIRKLD